MKKILIKRNEGIGDVLMTTCLINELKNDFEIYYHTFYPEIFINNKYVKLATKDLDLLNNIKFDKIIDLNWKFEAKGIGKGILDWNEYISVNRIDLVYKYSGIKKTQEIKLHYYPLKCELEIANNIWNELKGKKRIIYQIASISPIRTFPINKSLQLLSSLLEMGYSIIIIGHCMQWRFLDFVNKYYQFIKENLNLKYNGKNILDLTDRIPLRLSIALIATSDIGIFIDSGLLHFSAGALEKFTIALFGNIKPELRTKYYKNCINIFPKKVNCKYFPCFDPNPPPCPNFQEYIIKRHGIGALCMEAIDINEILSYLK